MTQTALKQSARFWDKMAAKYAASPISDMAAYEFTLERTRSYLTDLDHVLEIGCGTGSTALALAGNVARITGTDISPEMLRIAAEKAEVQRAGNVGFKVAGAMDAAKGAAAADVVMGFNILHLTPDMERILETLYRELKPGSLLITKTPCLSEPSVGIKRFAFRALVPVMQLLGKAPFVRYLSFQELEAAINWAGFKIIETSTNPAMSRYIVARRP
jgi:ubiquinone/menaquinone biosynthesis C-methylase UbiE